MDSKMIVQQLVAVRSTIQAAIEVRDQITLEYFRESKILSSVKWRADAVFSMIRLVSDSRIQWSDGVSGDYSESFSLQKKGLTRLVSIRPWGHTAEICICQPDLAIPFIREWELQIVPDPVCDLLMQIQSRPSE